MEYYVFTGEDCTSAFKDKGKVTPLKKLMNSPTEGEYSKAVPAMSARPRTSAL